MVVKTASGLISNLFGFKSPFKNIPILSIIYIICIYKGLLKEKERFKRSYLERINVEKKKKLEEIKRKLKKKEEIKKELRKLKERKKEADKEGARKS